MDKEIEACRIMEENDVPRMRKLVRELDSNTDLWNFKAVLYASRAQCFYFTCCFSFPDYTLNMSLPQGSALDYLLFNL